MPEAMTARSDAVSERNSARLGQGNPRVRVGTLTRLQPRLRAACFEMVEQKRRAEIITDHRRAVVT